MNDVTHYKWGRVAVANTFTIPPEWNDYDSTLDSVYTYNQCHGTFGILLVRGIKVRRQHVIGAYHE